MMEILTVQVFAAILGMVSITTADWLYYRGRIGRSYIPYGFLFPTRRFVFPYSRGFLLSFWGMGWLVGCSSQQFFL